MSFQPLIMQEQGDNMAFQIPGSIISAADQAKAAANALSAASIPSYADMMATIKSGAIHKDSSESLGALSSVGVDTGAVSSLIAKAKASMGIDMAVANAALAQKAKERQASGETLTQEDKDAAMAPLAVLKNLQSTMSSALSSATAAISSHASTLGANLSGLSPTAALNSAGAALSSFTASIPSQTIPDPANPGQTIPNPAYASFAAANAGKLSAMDSIASAASSAGASLTGAMSGFAAAASSAKADTISTLKADAMLATLTKPMPTAMASIANNNLNLGSIDKYTAIKAQEAPATVVPEKTPDPNRPSGASFVRENEKVLPPGNEKRIWTYELKQLADERDAAQVAYYAGFSTTTSATADERKTAMDAWILGLIGPAKDAIRKQSNAIKKAKPDAADRTAEEIAITEQSAAIGKDLAANNATYINVQTTLFGKWKELSDWYKELYNTWIGPNDRYTLNAKLLEKISKYTS